MNIAYLACPYSHPDKNVKEMRHRIVNQVAFTLMRQGTYVYSPLTHNLPIDRLGINGNWMYWKNFDHAMLARCDRIIVIKLPGWDESKGVAAELAYAKELGMSIEWIEPTEEMLQQANELSSSPLKDLISSMLKGYSERDWSKFHSPKNLAMNLGVEVGELMEHFRWLTEPQSYVESPQALKGIREEIGDVFIVLAHLAHSLGIDPIQAAYETLAKIDRRYPVDKCKGSCLKYTEYETSK